MLKKRGENYSLRLYVPKDIQHAVGRKEFAKAIDTSEVVKARTPHNYRIPLIGLTSGMRINEICQLFLDDLREVEGVLCFDINKKKEKRLKTTSSARLIPVHPELVQLGLIEYANKLKDAGHDRLFPLLKSGIRGYSTDFGKNISKYLNPFYFFEGISINAQCF